MKKWMSFGLEPEQVDNRKCHHLMSKDEKNIFNNIFDFNLVKNLNLVIYKTVIFHLSLVSECRWTENFHLDQRHYDESGQKYTFCGSGLLN